MELLGVLKQLIAPVETKEVKGISAIVGGLNLVPKDCASYCHRNYLL
jgi:hypothetical protein